MVWVRERTIPTERPPLLGEAIAKIADKGRHVVSVTDPSGRILGFLDRSRYFSIK
jgi:CBS-domain-containing membrane protein